MPAISAQQARRLLAAARAARLATVSADGAPHIVPVTFALHHDVIFSAVDAKPKTTRALRRLDNIRLEPRVAVLADHYDDHDWTALWWVRADGTASVIDDPVRQAEPIRLLAARYPQYRELPPAGPVIAVTVHRWTGWTGSRQG